MKTNRVFRLSGFLLTFILLTNPNKVLALRLTEVTPTVRGISMDKQSGMRNSMLSGIRLATSLRNNLDIDLSFEQAQTWRKSDMMRSSISFMQLGGRFYPGWRGNRHLFLTSGGGYSHIRLLRDGNVNDLYFYYGFGLDDIVPKRIINLPKQYSFRFDANHVMFQSRLNPFRTITNYKKNNFTAGISLVYRFPSGNHRLSQPDATHDKWPPIHYTEKMMQPSGGNRLVASADDDANVFDTMPSLTHLNGNKHQAFDYCPNSPAGVAVDSMGCPLDSDFDNTYDTFDDCPGSIPGIQVNRKGCMVDHDSDNVPDGIDKCPFTKPGLSVTINGCARDSDFDTVFDSLDFCPHTPPGVKVDRAGCTEDADLDGVANRIDTCPHSRRGARVDDTGCEIFKKKGDKVTLKGVNFDFDKFQIRQSGKKILKKVAQLLMQKPDMKINITGHTDNIGTAQYNYNLSEKRARSVLQYLVTLGINRKNLKYFGYAGKKPIADNNTESGRALNRRVELKRVN